MHGKRSCWCTSSAVEQNGSIWQDEKVSQAGGGILFEVPVDALITTPTQNRGGRAEPEIDAQALALALQSVARLRIFAMVKRDDVIESSL